MRLTLKECEALARAAQWVLRRGVVRAERAELASALRKLQMRLRAPWPRMDVGDRG